MPLEREDLHNLVGLTVRVLSELRKVREESERQNELLREIAARLESLERMQFS